MKRLCFLWKLLSSWGHCIGLKLSIIPHGIMDTLFFSSLHSITKGRIHLCCHITDRSMNTVQSHQVQHLRLVSLLRYIILQRLLTEHLSQPEAAPSTLHLGKKLDLDIVGTEHAQAPDPAWLEEKERSGQESSHRDHELCRPKVPGGDEVKEDDGRHHEEEGDDVVDEAERAGEDELGLVAATAGAAVAGAGGGAGEAEGERRHKRNHEDVREGEDQTEELLGGQADQRDKSDQ